MCEVNYPKYKVLEVIFKFLHYKLSLRKDLDHMAS